jgi:predicted transcriptional regulator
MNTDFSNYYDKSKNQYLELESNFDCFKELEGVVEIGELDDLDELNEMVKFVKLTKTGNGSFYYFQFILPLYSKLNTSSIFSNHSRGEILNLIIENPGITLGSITKKLKLKTGTATHHLRILEREGYIKSKKTGKFRRFYKLGIKTTGYNEHQDKIVNIVQEHPGITQSDIGRELKMSRQLVNYHIKELVSKDVIASERIGNKCNYYHT